MKNLLSRRSLAALAAGAVISAGLIMAGPALAGPTEPTASQQGKVNTSTFGNLAIDGYDPVAYFTESKPVKGSRDFTTDWNGATYRFASAANRDLFIADPAKYAPQYGGYCAYGVAQDTLAPIEPDAWSIVDGKLYLNYDKDIQKKWTADIPGYLQKAEKNWAGLQ